MLRLTHLRETSCHIASVETNGNALNGGSACLFVCIELEFASLRKTSVLDVTSVCTSPNVSKRQEQCLIAWKAILRRCHLIREIFRLLRSFVCSKIITRQAQGHTLTHTLWRYRPARKQPHCRMKSWRNTAFVLLTKYKMEAIFLRIPWAPPTASIIVNKSKDCTSGGCFKFVFNEVQHVWHQMIYHIRVTVPRHYRTVIWLVAS